MNHVDLNENSKNDLPNYSVGESFPNSYLELPPERNDPSDKGLVGKLLEQPISGCPGAAAVTEKLEEPHNFLSFYERKSRLERFTIYATT